MGGRRGFWFEVVGEVGDAPSAMLDDEGDLDDLDDVAACGMARSCMTACSFIMIVFWSVASGLWLGR